MAAGKEKKKILCPRDLQILSLALSQLGKVNNCCNPGWNQGPLDLQSNALPTKLSRLVTKSVKEKNLAKENNLAIVEVFFFMICINKEKKAIVLFLFSISISLSILNATWAWLGHIIWAHKVLPSVFQKLLR
jgi:hypothetical protein